MAGVAQGISTITATAEGQHGSAVVTVVASTLEFTALSPGFGHTCALTSTGAAYCWGDNTDGQLGNGSHTASTKPVPISGGHSFSTIVPGEGHTCGLTSGGAAYCWGDDHWGELGDSSNTCEICESSVPVAVYGGLRFRTLGGGGGYTCGLTNDGPAYCWGLNDSGQLGDGSTTDRSAPVLVAGTSY